MSYYGTSKRKAHIVLRDKYKGIVYSGPGDFNYNNFRHASSETLEISIDAAIITKENLLAECCLNGQTVRGEVKTTYFRSNSGDPYTSLEGKGCFEVN